MSLACNAVCVQNIPEVTNGRGLTMGNNGNEQMYGRTGPEIRHYAE